MPRIDELVREVARAREQYDTIADPDDTADGRSSTQPTIIHPDASRPPDGLAFAMTMASYVRVQPLCTAPITLEPAGYTVTVAVEMRGPTVAAPAAPAPPGAGRLSAFE